MNISGFEMLPIVIVINVILNLFQFDFKLQVFRFSVVNACQEACSL